MVVEVSIPESGLGMSLPRPVGEKPQAARSLSCVLGASLSSGWWELNKGS